eukprot:6490393-Amphidinium_carterae.2
MGEPATKKAKVKAAACLACKVLPGKSQWAEVEKSGGKTTAVGDRCLECHEYWQSYFAYLDWGGFATLWKSEAASGKAQSKKDRPHTL